MTIAVLLFLCLLNATLVIAVRQAGRVMDQRLARIDAELQAIHAAHEAEARSRQQRIAEFMERRGSGRDLLTARLAARLAKDSAQKS